MSGSLMILRRPSPTLGERERGHLWWTPPAYERRGDWPLILFLHGKGERGEDPARAAVHGPLAEVARGRLPPACILAPSCPALEEPGETRWTRWDDLVPDVLDLLDHVLEHERVRADRVSLCGISMGGRGTLLLGARHPDRFARLLAFCPWAEDTWAPALSRTPSWIFHGLDDEVVPCAGSVRIASRVQRLAPDEGRATLSLLPGVGHDCWTEAFAGEEVWRFLLDAEWTPSGGENPSNR